MAHDWTHARGITRADHHEAIESPVRLHAYGLASFVTDAATEIDCLSRHFVSGWKRFVTQLIDVFSGQESLSSDSDAGAQRIALPIGNRRAPTISDIECSASIMDAVACRRLGVIM